MQIEILSSEKIDKQKWDACILQSNNPLIYATSVYLDHMAESWEGFIAGDYNIVMPVPWKKKYGIKYCYHVQFVQQLGVFGKNFTQEQAESFAQCLKQNYKYGDYSFNYLNQIKDASHRNNYILLLSSKYKILKEFYSADVDRNLQKAKKFLLKYTVSDVEEAIETFKKLYADRFKNITSAHYKKFFDLCNIKQQENNVIVRKIINNNNELLACILLLKDDRRYYNLMMSSTPAGRKQSAGHLLFDEIIKELSHNGVMLDFEGSDIEGIESFYKGFGAVNQPYYKIHLNNLKFPLNLLKR